jgi:hypothetical protein
MREMLSSMAQTRVTLETSAPNQLSASENEAASKCSWRRRSLAIEAHGNQTGPMV